MAQEQMQETGTTGGGEAATPEEQAAYERVVLAGMKVLYSQETHQNIVQMLGQGEPAEAMATAVTIVMSQLDERSGGKIPEVVIFPAAAELLGQVAEIAEAAKVAQVDDRVVARAMQILVVKLADQYGIDPADAQALVQSVEPEQLQQIVAEQQQIAQGGGSREPAPAETEQPTEEG